MTDDEQEAKSIKYNVARIVRLRSGNFALFDPFTNKDGLPLIHIGSIDEIGELVPSVEEVSAYLAENEEVRPTVDDGVGRGLLASLGLLKPKEPIKRRV